MGGGASCCCRDASYRCSRSWQAKQRQSCGGCCAASCSAAVGCCQVGLQLVHFSVPEHAMHHRVSSWLRLTSELCKIWRLECPQTSAASVVHKNMYGFVASLLLEARL